MSLHGYCPHGHRLPCAEAVKAGASKTLDIYIQHPYPHEEGQ